MSDDAQSNPRRLSELGRGQTSSVLAVTGDDAIGRRLVDLGFTPGVEVTLEHVSTFGWPRSFRLHDYRLALRRDEATRVLVGPRG